VWQRARLAVTCSPTLHAAGTHGWRFTYRGLFPGVYEPAVGSNNEPTAATLCTSEFPAAVYPWIYNPPWTCWSILAKNEEPQS
jgi:hypothetical protein